VLNPRQKSATGVEYILAHLCEQHLPEVFRYINYWVNNTRIAEDLTMKALRNAFNGYKGSSNKEAPFLTGLFTLARKEIQDYLKINPLKPVLPNLSTQEQEVISLKLGAILDNRRVAQILNLPESSVSQIIHDSLCKLNGSLAAPK
jgi:DNA-directed RNA polymerase specialized sigma24 family protein